MSELALPTLSFAERDRRWAAVRALMRQHGVECLLVAGFRTREMYESYVADDYNEGAVVFPVEGEPVILTWAHLRVLRARDSAARGFPLWISDYRVATSGAAAAEAVREQSLAGDRLGVVGLRSAAPTEIYGGIPAGFWSDFSGALPGITFVDLSEEFSLLMLTKSSEEQALIRYAAGAAEAACEVMRDLAEPGVGEETIFAEVTRTILRRGISLRYPSIVMNSGPHTLSWGPPRWTTRAEPPRRLERGDIVCAEIMPVCGNQEVQVQMSVALDPLDSTNLRCETAARACYDAGLRVLRPGVRFSDLVAAMAEPLKEYGCWSFTPLVHSVSPHFLIGFTPVNAESVNFDIRWLGSPSMFPPRDTVLREGMVLAFEPNACIGDHRVNIGGTVLVTADGATELNSLPTQLTHK